MVLRLENQPPTRSIAEFCVPALGYCLNYDQRFFAEPERDNDAYGARLSGREHPFTGELSGRVDGLQLRLEQRYLLRMREMEAIDPELTELNSMMANGFYYLSLRAAGKLYYFQAWTRDDRLVQLRLEAPGDLPAAVWEEAIRGFRVTFR